MSSGLGQVLFLGLLCFLALSHPAVADPCAEPATPLLKAICTNPKAKLAYVDLSTHYQKALARLSPKGQAILIKSQQNWRDRSAEECLVSLDVWAARKGRFGEYTPGNCLIDSIADRRSFIEKQGYPEGAYIWQNIDFALDQYCRDDKGTSTDVVSIRRDSVRIDGPETAQTLRWNDQHKVDPDLKLFGDVLADPCTYKGTNEITISLVFTDGDFLNLRESDLSYFGSDRPESTYVGSHLELISSGKVLTADDFFIRSDEWKKFAADRLFAQYLKGDPGDELGFTAHDFEGPAAETANWIVDRHALHFNFGPYTLAGYSEDDPPEITWRELRPYLRSDLPFHPDFN
jgi:uncharacterized protein YecT (DUF1311 family)